MLFRLTWKQVLDGIQTEVRIPKKVGETLLPDLTRVISGSRTKWKVGNTYAIQPGKDQKAVGRIRLLEIEEGTLDQLGITEAQAEGFASLENFIAAWEDAYGSYRPDQPVWILRFEREPTPEEKAARKLIEQEDRLRQMAATQTHKLSSVGHKLGEWQPDGDLQLKNACSRCEGSVTVSVGEINMVGYIPLMHSDVCLADYPEQMEAAREEWQRRLASVYQLILSLGRKRRMRETENRIE